MSSEEMEHNSLSHNSASESEDHSKSKKVNNNESTEEDNKSEMEEDLSTHETVESPQPEQSQQAKHIDEHLVKDKEDDGAEKLVKDFYTVICDRIHQEEKQFSAQHLREYTNLSSLKEATKQISTHLQFNQQFIQSMLIGFSETRKCLHKFNETIINKINSENLKTWVDTSHHKDEDAVAYEKEMKAEAAEIREAVIQVEKQLATVTQMCAEMEQETLDARQMAVEARKEAEAAARRAEEAAQAAKAKARREEEERKKAEQAARKKAEDDRIRKEMEEKRKAELEKMKGTPEEQERINPNNWPIYIYKEDESSSEFDAGYNCLIRAMPGVMAQDDVKVTRLKQLESGLKLENNDELISYVISVEAVTKQENVHNDEESEEDAKVHHKLPLEEPLSVLIPHCAPRNLSREMVVMWKEHEAACWVTLEAKECSIEAIKDAKLAECRPMGYGTYAVIYRLKTDTFTISKKGGKVNSSVDSRFVIQCRPGVFRFNTSFTCQLQPVDLASVSEVKQRYPDECSSIISSSPIAKLHFPTETLSRPINIIVPIPANNLKAKRPITAIDKERKPLSRPSSAAFGLGSYGIEEETEDCLHTLVYTAERGWYVTEKLQYSPLNKKGDLITMETAVIPEKFWILRVKASAAAADVELLANTLYDYLHQRLVQFIMRQKADDFTDVALVCANLPRVDRALRLLEDEGYTDGSAISKEVFVKEGQKLEIRFRGNIQPDEEVSLVLPYNSHLKTQVNMYVTEIDKFAQKSFSSYRGFAQFYTEGYVQRDVYDEADKKKEQRKPIGTEQVWDSILLAELLISLPKPEPETPRPLKKAKVSICSEGPIDEEYLKQLSADLGDEWKLLAVHLGVKNTRIQSIMRNNVNNNTPQAVYEMLLTWIKRVPRSVDKCRILCDALRRVGHYDIADEVACKENEYKEQRAEQMREHNLKQVFIKVAQSPSVIAKWKDLAGHLGVSNTDTLNIENEHAGGRERCLRILDIWKESGDKMSPPIKLIRSLKLMKCSELANEVRKMTTYH